MTFYKVVVLRVYVGFYNEKWGSISITLILQQTFL